MKAVTATILLLGLLGFSQAKDTAFPPYGIYWAEKWVRPASDSAPGGRLSLEAFPQEGFAEESEPDISPENLSILHQHFPLLLTNRTKETTSLPTSDTQLYVVEEARDER